MHPFETSFRQALQATYSEAVNRSDVEAGINAILETASVCLTGRHFAAAALDDLAARLALTDARRLGRVEQAREELAARYPAPKMLYPTTARSAGPSSPLYRPDGRVVGSGRSKAVQQTQRAPAPIRAIRPVKIPRLPQVVNSQASATAVARRVVDRAAKNVALLAEAEGHQENPFCPLGFEAEDLTLSPTADCIATLRVFHQEYRDAWWEQVNSQRRGPPAGFGPWDILTRYLVDAPIIAPHGTRAFRDAFQEACASSGGFVPPDELKIVIRLFNSVVITWRGAIPLYLLNAAVAREVEACSQGGEKELAGRVAWKCRQITKARTDASFPWGARGVRKRIKTLEDRRNASQPTADRSGTA